MGSVESEAATFYETEVVGPTLQPTYSAPLPRPTGMSHALKLASLIDHIALGLKRPVLGAIPPLEASVPLFPRRKAGDLPFLPSRGRAPMRIDRDMIVALFNMPQTQAAQHLRISTTALKQVCRKLGVSRWPYTRGKKRINTMTNPQPVTITGAVEFDDDVTDVANTREYKPADAAQGTHVHWDGYISHYCIIKAASTDDEMTEPQSGASTAKCDEIADANENKPAAAAQDTYLGWMHWDGFESAYPHA